MSIKKLSLLTFILLGSINYTKASTEDYYDFKWEIKRIEATDEMRKPSNEQIETAQANKTIKLTNDPIIIEVKTK